MVHAPERIHHRSGVLPLEVFIRFPKVDYPKARDAFKRIIAQNPSRCEKITLLYSEWFPLTPDGETIWDCFTLYNEPLHTTHFTIYAQSTPALNRLPPFAPSIPFLRIDLTCCLDWTTLIFPSALTTLTLKDGGRYYYDTAKIARCWNTSLCHSLKSLSLLGIRVDVLGPDDPIHTCVLNSVEFFELDMPELSEAIDLLSTILTPNVRHLALKRIGGGHPYKSHNARWSILRFPHLRKLTLLGFYQNPGALVTLIQNLPNTVNWLEIMDGRGGNSIIEALQHSSATNFCLQIEHLVTLHIPMDSLVSLVEERFTSLQTLEIGCDISRDYTSLWGTKGQLKAYLNTLRCSVPELTFSRDYGYFVSVI